MVQPYVLGISLYRKLDAWWHEFSLWMVCLEIYGSWYLYLLTGEHKYMKQVINALGSCLQLVNINTHKLNFSFYLTHISIVTNSMRFLLVQAFLNFNASALENNTFPQSVTGTKNLMKLGVKMGD